jgi:hypothetical protein
MGPLLPLAALFGGIWYLDKEKQPQVVDAAPKDVRPVPHFSKMAVSVVTEMKGEVRYFKACDIDLSHFALEYIPLEGASAIAMFRLVPLDIGAIGAGKAVEHALSKGLSVLGSLSLALSAPGTDPMLLLFVPPGKEALASPASQFAVLAQPAPVAEATEVVEAEPPKKKAPRNGIVKIEEPKPFPAPPNGEKPAEA